MLNFDVESRVEGDRAIVTLRGDFDLQVAERVVAELAKVEEHEPELLVMDLRQLSFLDSSGMGVIAAAQARAAEAGRRIVIVRPPSNVQRAFELSRLDDVITMVDDIDAV